MVLYILLAIILSVILITIIGLLLPEERTETRQTTFNAPPEVVYSTVINNKDYSYRSNLKEIKILKSENEFEEWEEITDDGNIIRFSTRDKKPYSLYSFDMQSKLFNGYWTADFKETDNGDTLFIATEYIRIKNPLIKALSYLFFDIGKLMDIYQEDLRNKLKTDDLIKHT